MTGIYLDHNATSPMLPEVAAAMSEPWAAEPGNPSSLHGWGQRALRVVDRARAQVAGAVGASPDEIVFTSGGTEADNLALKGACWAIEAGGGCHLLAPPVEHQAVRNTLSWLAGRSASLTWLPVDSAGRTDPEAVSGALDEVARRNPGARALVSVMLAHHDLGTIQPVARIAALARERGALVHTDAVQALGKVPVDVEALGVDLLSLSGHKIGGPRGVGALYVRRGTPLEPLLHGGHQERRRRAGTENVAGAVGLGRACASLATREESAALRALRDRLEGFIVESIPDVQVHGHPRERLGNTLLVTFGGVSGEVLMLSLDLEGIGVSTGAACTAGLDEPSYVLSSIGVPEERRRSGLRFSLGPGQSSADIDRVCEVLPGLVERIRRNGGER